MTRRTWLVVGTILALTVIALGGTQLAGLLGTPLTIEASATERDDTVSGGTIIVVGHGLVSTVPDMAYATLGVELYAPNVTEATEEVSSRMEAVLKSLMAQGIDEKDIRTTNYSIRFQRESPSVGAQVLPRMENDSEEMEGVYRVTNEVSVKIRDMEAVGEVIDEAVIAGANRILGISFRVEDTDALVAESRAKAVADAKARAAELAGLSDVKLGQVISISEVVGVSPELRSAMPVTALAMEAAGPSPISPGGLQITTQIQMVFAIQ